MPHRPPPQRPLGRRIIPRGPAAPRGRGPEKTLPPVQRPRRGQRPSRHPAPTTAQGAPAHLPLRRAPPPALGRTTRRPSAPARVPRPRRERGQLRAPPLGQELPVRALRRGGPGASSPGSMHSRASRAGPPTSPSPPGGPPSEPGAGPKSPGRKDGAAAGKVPAARHEAPANPPIHFRGEPRRSPRQPALRSGFGDQPPGCPNHVGPRGQAAARRPARCAGGRGHFLWNRRGRDGHPVHPRPPGRLA